MKRQRKNVQGFQFPVVVVKSKEVELYSMFTSDSPPNEETEFTKIDDVNVQSSLLAEKNSRLSISQSIKESVTTLGRPRPFLYTNCPRPLGGTSLGLATFLALMPEVPHLKQLHSRTVLTGSLFPNDDGDDVLIPIDMLEFKADFCINNHFFFIVSRPTIDQLSMLHNKCSNAGVQFFHGSQAAIYCTVFPKKMIDSIVSNGAIFTVTTVLEMLYYLEFLSRIARQ